jgi:hypothetical protein
MHRPNSHSAARDWPRAADLHHQFRNLLISKELSFSMADFRIKDKSLKNNQLKNYDVLTPVSTSERRGCRYRSVIAPAHGCDRGRYDHGGGSFHDGFRGLVAGRARDYCVGNGLFLPSLPSQIDSLYPPDDPRRKSAYNLNHCVARYASTRSNPSLTSFWLPTSSCAISTGSTELQIHSFKRRGSRGSN